MTMWRSVVDVDDGREFFVPEAALWEISAREEKGDEIELLLRRVTTGETMIVHAEKRG